MANAKCKNTTLMVYKDIAGKFIYGLIISFAVTILIWGSLWNQDRNLVHTILESASVCIGIAIFLIT